MKRVSFILVYYTLFHISSAAQVLMRDVFAAMPDSVMPLVSKNNRLDCIDFIENNMEAKVRNQLDEYVTLEALTVDYARFRTSALAVMELKLLPTTDSTSVLCVVTTVQMGEEGTAQRMEDSMIRFLDSDWSPLSPDSLRAFDENTYANITFYIGEKSETPTGDFEQALRSLKDFHPLKMALSADEASLTLTLQTAQLSKEEREAVNDYLFPLKLTWNGRRFVTSSH